jgi:hypothetical protein
MKRSDYARPHCSDRILVGAAAIPSYVRLGTSYPWIVALGSGNDRSSRFGVA